MKIKSLGTSVLLIGASCAGCLLGKQAYRTYQDCENEKVKLETKINTLEKDIFELRNEKASELFPLQIDKLENIPTGLRSPEFLEKVINNAAILDSINETDEHIGKVINNLSKEEFGHIVMSDHFSEEVGRRIGKYYVNHSAELQFK